MSTFYKKIEDKTIIKEGSDIVIFADGKQIINPTEDLILSDEWNYYEYSKPTLNIEQKRQQLVDKIIAYDNGSNINEFFVGETSMWLDKATRCGLRDRLLSESALGKTETTLWYNLQMFVVDIEKAKHMLILLENYASECYDNTQRHISEVLKLDTVEKISTYDYTVGYPEKLVFEI